MEQNISVTLSLEIISRMFFNILKFSTLIYKIFCFFYVKKINFLGRTQVNSTTDRTAIFEFRSKRDAFVIRIAEMYLIVAEAEMTSNPTEAVNYMNMLRSVRAVSGREAEMQITVADLNIDFILEERARELGGELLRWFDLKRTGKLLEYVRAYNPNASENIKEKHLLRPIPQSHLDRITNKDEFPQNTGW